jgi:archaellum component FlaF (FlaF/FlaG flagellin family)
MNIEDVKVGTRVICLDDNEGVIPTGALGTIIQDNNYCPYISWDVKFSEDFFERYGYHNVYALRLTEVEVVEEVEQQTLSKLTVTISDEDKEEIAKDILKIVLKDLNVIITDAIDNLSNGNEEVKQPLDVPTAASNINFSDEKLQSMFEEVMKDVMKEYLQDSINTLNKTAFGI